MKSSTYVQEVSNLWSRTCGQEIRAGFSAQSIVLMHIQSGILDDAAQRLEGSIDPVYYPVRGENAQDLALAPFTQNLGHPREIIKTQGQCPSDDAASHAEIPTLTEAPLTRRQPKAGAGAYFCAQSLLIAAKYFPTTIRSSNSYSIFCRPRRPISARCSEDSDNIFTIF